ncbi:MAG: alpha/beta hydrolase [Thioalkalispiraceae bacterium]|jgi:fermentation-respiration switch protein FrsA (DUF1100 family)
MGSLHLNKLLKSLLLPIVAGLLVLNAWFYMLQPGMLFYPFERIDATPADWGLEYENVAMLTADNVQLHGWYLPVKQSRQVVLFFHGNGGNISHRGDSLKILHDLGLNVFIIDYRGYGLSEGRLSENGLYQDAMAAWLYLQNQRGHQQRDIIIFGRSLGGAVAIWLASQVEARALIVESVFSSVRDMASQMMPGISRFIYLRYGFDNLSGIRRVNEPLLVMHSPDDEIIPFQLGERVFAAANTPKYFYRLHGGHNEGFLKSMPSYQQVIKQFLEKSTP